MNLPLAPYEIISDNLNLVLALIIGIGFGFVLERGGLGNAKKLVGQFLLTDMTVFKVMFSAIVTAMLGLFFLSVFGVLNINLISNTDAYILPQAVGGILLGIGFALAGYCPGTTIVGMATGKKDALVCFLGLLLGTWLFVLSFEYIESFYWSTELSNKYLYRYFNINYGSVIFLISLVAIVGFYISDKLENRPMNQPVAQRGGESGL